MEIKNISIIFMGCTNSTAIDIKDENTKPEEKILCPVKKFLVSNKEYFLEQINTGCLAQFCYYIESNGEAAIIDPLRDIEVYLSMLEKRNAKLKYIFETHFHADFVSGHLDLANKTGAEIIFGPTANPEYKIIVAKDYENFKLGNINIKVIHTPGHTLESSCFLILDQNNIERVIFSGDTIFLGEVGRPDLAVKGEVDEKTLAGYLFDSIQKIKKFSDEVLIFPGHGAGSACGKKISSGSGDTLKNQKEKNYALSDLLNKEEFIELATTNLPKPPSYFFFDAVLNKKGYESIEKVLERCNKGINPKELDKYLNSEDFKNGNIVLLDTRDFLIANKAFIKGSVIIPLKITYAIWTATLFKPDTKFILITDKGKEKESIFRLSRVGYDQTLGYLEGEIEEYQKYKNEQITSVQMPSQNEIKVLIDNKKVFLIDVREITEVELSGKIEYSVNYPLSQLTNYIEELRKNDKPIGLSCKTGGRASLAASILVKNDFKGKDIYVLGGFDSLKDSGLKVNK